MIKTLLVENIVFWGPSTAGLCILPQAPDAPFAVICLELFTNMNGRAEGWGGIRHSYYHKNVLNFVDNTSVWLKIL